MKEMTAAVIGCGMISGIYLKNLTGRFEGIRVKSCCAARLENAQRKAAEYGIHACSFEEILADDEVKLVIVLTPAPTHYGLIKAALLAGKHVYSEKTMTLTSAEAKELCALADEKGLHLGCAPDTFLGGAWQKAAQMLRDGELGAVSGFDVYVNRNLDRMTSLYPFLQLPGGGILYDFGVYHLTVLVELLGRVKEVCSVVENKKPIRYGTVEGTKDFGREYSYPNEAQVTAILRMESGVVGTLTLNGESIAANLHHFRIYGEKGVLELPDPNGFGGDVTLTRSRTDKQVVNNDLPYIDNCRGIGAWDMVCAMEDDRLNGACKELALHVLNVMEAIVKSSKEKRFITCT